MIIKEFISPIESEEAVVDVEISNDISEDWDYEKGEVVTVGILYKDKIKIIQKEKEDDYAKFMTSVEVELRKHKSVWAFNFNMEKGCLYKLTTLYWDVKEIKPFRGKGGSKENMFNDLVKNKKVLKVDIPKDPLKGDSSKVQDAYYENRYEDIILHNLNCLVKECFIFINRHWFLETYKDKIKDGWWTHKIPFGEH